MIIYIDNQNLLIELIQINKLLLNILKKICTLSIIGLIIRLLSNI